MPDEPTIVAVETVQTAATAERNGAEWWVRIWGGGHSILLHPNEAVLFATQIHGAARQAHAQTKEAKS